MNTQQASIYHAIRTALLLLILMLLSFPALLAQEQGTNRFTVEGLYPEPEKYSVGIESGMNFNRVTFDQEHADSTATGRSSYMSINGSYSISSQFGLQVSGSYEEVKWSTTQDHWDLPTSSTIRSAFGLPDSLGNMTSPRQSMSVTTPHVSVSAHVRFNPTSWLGLLAGGTVQFRAGNGTVKRTWQAMDSAGRIPFTQTTTLPVIDNLPSRRYALDGKVVITPLAMKQVDFSIHAAYRVFLAEDYPEQSAPINSSLSQTERSGEALRQIPSTTLTSMMQIGAGFSYRF